jgi:RTX calcium-binding nonapeptide repeat (4 copies)
VRLRLLSDALLGRRSVVGLVGAVGVMLIVTGVAAADAIVRTAGTGGSTLEVEAETRSGPDGSHGVIIEPFERNGDFVSRVRQQALGNPSIRSNEALCDHNPVFNDVVCRASARRIVVTMGDGDDRVQIREVSPNGVPGCVGVEPTWTVEVTLGSGDDVLTAGLAPTNPCTTGQFSNASRRSSMTASGGGGNDVLNATSLGSTLEGGSGRDELTGTNRGNDTLRGGSGADLMSGGSSTTAGDFDTATYSEVGSGSLSLTLDGQANDGVANEGDNIAHSIERVIGGGGQDSINGNDLPNTLVGGGGSDSINGRGGADVLEGGDDGDELAGAEGVDRFTGGGGNDFIQARDGEFESISCGDGIVDSVIGDLADFFTAGRVGLRNRNGLDCEAIDTFAVDDGPPARAVGRSLTVAAGRTSVTVACPRNARVACRGTLSARVGGIRGRVIGRARYSVRLGGRASVSVRLGNRRAGTRIVLETMEQGVSKKGPRSATRLAVVR